MVGFTLFHNVLQRRADRDLRLLQLGHEVFHMLLPLRGFRRGGTSRVRERQGGRGACGLRRGTAPAQQVHPMRQRVVLPSIDLARACETDLFRPHFRDITEVRVEKIPIVPRGVRLHL